MAREYNQEKAMENLEYEPEWCEQCSFEKYFMYERKNSKIVKVNPKAFELADEAFILFKDLFDTHYGAITEDENLISIHTGGWSENEVLINEFKHTGWWFKYHKITAKGGHYYFNTDVHGEKEWIIGIKI